MSETLRAPEPLFMDDFDSLDWSRYLTRWWYVDPGWNGCSLPSNGELQLYVNRDGPLDAEPWTVKNSILSLTCAQTSQPVDGYDYLSGMINSYPSFWRVYGFFEARLKMPPGNGMWPAFWLLPMDGSWPPEIDVVEWLGREPSTRYCGTHSNAGGWHWTQGGPTSIPDGSAGFHDYGDDWQANEMAFTFDGETVFSCPTPPDMHKPMYWILNLALGGGWAGPPDASTPWPASLQVDWVRVFEVSPYGPQPGPPSGAVYPLENPWSAVDLRGSFKPGDSVRFDFVYDFAQVIFAEGDSYVWVRQSGNITLAAVLPGRLDLFGLANREGHKHGLGWHTGIGGGGLPGRAP